MKKKNFTIENLADLIERKFQESNKRTDQKINELAILTNKAFKSAASEDKQRFNILLQGQEEIISKLTNVAYRFELIELEKRINVLEKKVGIAK